jgi:bifunctional non-homologous end joining protein LigD
VIGGYTYGGAPRPGHPGRTDGPFASLLIGQYDASGALRFVGEVSGGFDAASAADVVDALDAIRSPEPPFAGHPAAGRLVFWCHPELAVTVRFAGWGPDGRLRFPLLEWLRPDIPAEKCRLPEGSAQ